MSYFNSIKITDGTHDLDITASSAAKVDGSAVTQPVSGTVTANAGTNLNTSALATSALQLADGHNVTIDNISSNEVYVRGSGTAGSADAGVLSVQGIASMTPLSVTESSPLSGFATSAGQLADGHNVTIDNISSNEVFVRGSQSAGSAVDGEVMTVQGIASMTPIATTESSPISGFATSANQLADGHNVTIDNASADEVYIRGGGTAGSATDGEVVAVQGIASGTAMAVTESSPISGFATSAKQLADGHNVVISSGTVTTVSTLSAITGLTMSNAAAQVTGDEAHDAVDAGNPVKIGGRAQEPTTALDEVADNDRTDGAFDRQGRLAVWMGYPVQTAIINDAGSGDNTIQAAAGAGLRIAVMGYHLISDGTVDYRWEDGAGGTAFTGQIPLQAREGVVAGYGMQPMWVGTANTLLNLELSAAINVHGQVSFLVMTD